jgi:hypothetical protein
MHLLYSLLFVVVQSVTMEEYSYGDEYFAYHDDGSSFRTSLTPYSVDPSMTTRTGIKLRRESPFFDRLVHACRTSCDALWWLITESSSPDEIQYQSINRLPTRSHKLRIVGDDSKRSSHPTESSESNPPPIKWKNKGKSASLSLQSNSSSGISSSLSSSVEIAGGDGKGVSGGSHTKDQQRCSHPKEQQHDSMTAYIPGHSEEKSIVAEGSDSSGYSATDLDKELQTVDSKILLRKRQKGKTKDVIRFKNLKNPEIINAGPPNRGYAADPEHQQSRSQLPSKGLPPLIPRQSGSKKSSGNRRANKEIEGSISDGLGCVPNSSVASTSTIALEPWDYIQEDSVLPNKIDTVVRQSAEIAKIRNTCQKTPDPFWNQGNQSQRNEHEITRIARSFDGMEVAQKQIPFGRHHHTVRQEFSSETHENNAEVRDATSAISFSGVNDLVRKLATEATIDKYDSSRDVEGHSTAVLMKNDWSNDESVSSSIHKSKSESVSSSDASSSYKDTVQYLSRSDGKPTMSSLSVRSSNSAYYKKEAWLTVRNRPSFEYKNINNSLYSWSQESVSKPRKPCGKPRMPIPHGTGSVASMDRKMGRRHIQARKEDGTMSVY